MIYIFKYTGTLNAYRVSADSVNEARDKVLKSTGVINLEMARNYLRRVVSDMSELRIQDIS